jgi:hypothetical protein
VYPKLYEQYVKLYREASEAAFEAQASYQMINDVTYNGQHVQEMKAKYGDNPEAWFVNLFLKQVFMRPDVQRLFDKIEETRYSGKKGKGATKEEVLESVEFEDDD